MSPAKLSRLGGVALIVGGVFFAIGNLLHPVDHTLASQAQPTWIAAHLTFLAGGCIMLLGLPTIYARQADRAGWLGLISFVVLSFGIVGLGPGAFYEAFVVKAIDQTSKLAIENGPSAAFSGIMGICYLGGAILFAISTFQARVYPRAAAATIGISTLILFAVSPFTSAVAGIAIIACTAVWGLGFAWIGAAHLAALRATNTVRSTPAQRATASQQSA